MESLNKNKNLELIEHFVNLIDDSEQYIIVLQEAEDGDIIIEDPISINVEAQEDISETTELTKLITPALYHCSECPYSSGKRHLVTRHMRRHSTYTPYICNFCDKKFKTAASLQNHNNTHLSLKPHSCSHCAAPFRTSGELIRHVRYKHSLEKPHKCLDCDYAAVELSKLRRHVRSHTGEKPYQCRHCTYASPDSFKLKRHLRIHTGEKPYQCDLCQMRFTQSNSLKKHKLIHNISEKPVFLCPLCPAKCGRVNDLRVHLRNLHSDNGNHKCKRCHKVFQDRYSYKIHVRSHQGEKSYKCGLCPYAADSYRHLKSHSYQHTKESPFGCEECGHVFKQKQLLRRHHNLHHNPAYLPSPPKEKVHECFYCHRKYANKGNLIRHMERHDLSRSEKYLKRQKPKNKNYVKNDNESLESLLTIGGDQEYMVIHVTDLKENKDETNEQDECDNLNKMSCKMQIDTYFGFAESDVEV